MTFRYLVAGREISCVGDTTTLAFVCLLSTDTHTHTQRHLYVLSFVLALGSCSFGRLWLSDNICRFQSESGFLLCLMPLKEELTYCNGDPLIL